MVFRSMRPQLLFWRLSLTHSLGRCHFLSLTLFHALGLTLTLTLMLGCYGCCLLQLRKSFCEVQTQQDWDCPQINMTMFHANLSNVSC